MPLANTEIYLSALVGGTIGIAGAVIGTCWESTE